MTYCGCCEKEKSDRNWDHMYGTCGDCAWCISLGLCPPSDDDDDEPENLTGCCHGACKPQYNKTEGNRMTEQEETIYTKEDKAIAEAISTLVADGKRLEHMELRDNNLNYREIWCEGECLCFSRFHMDNGLLEHELVMYPEQPKLKMRKDDGVLSEDDGADGGIVLEKKEE